MNDERLTVYLGQMRQASLDALSFVDGQSKQEFDTDKRTQQAVTLSLLVVGELASKVLTEFGDFAALHQDVPWVSMRGMRNRIAHGYVDMNIDVVWHTVKTAIPNLLSKLEGL